MPWAKWVNERGLAAFEKLVTKTKGKFCIGDEVTLADVFLAPQLFSAVRFGADLTQFPNIMEIFANFKDLPEFVTAHAENQIDCVK